MARFKKIAVAVAIIDMNAWASRASAGPDDVCYDRAIIGHIRSAENFVGLEHFIQAPTGVEFGGRWDIDIGVDQVLAGASSPAIFSARAVLTALPTPNAQMLLLVKRGPIDLDKDNTVQEWNGRFIPRASTQFPWRVVFVGTKRGRVDPRDPTLPPRCP